jgi:hypothetical protein
VARKREIVAKFGNEVVLNYTYLHAITRFCTMFLAVTLTSEMECWSRGVMGRGGKRRVVDGPVGAAFPTSSRLGRRKWLISRFQAG